MSHVSLYKKFNETSIADVPVAGSKNASLGEMFTQLSSKGVNVPDGFATTAFSFWYYIDHNKLRGAAGDVISVGQTKLMITV